MTRVGSCAVLWRSLPKAEQHRLISRFVHLQPDQLRDLGAQEAGWLFAWIFEQQGLIARRIEPGREWVDLELVPGEARKAEFARIYIGKRGTPLNAVYATLEALESRTIIKLHLYTLGHFPPSMKHISDQFPLAVEQQDYEDLVCRLLEAQASYRVRLHQRCALSSGPRQPVLPEPGGLWVNLADWFKRR